MQLGPQPVTSHRAATHGMTENRFWLQCGHVHLANAALLPFQESAVAHV